MTEVPQTDEVESTRRKAHSDLFEQFLINYTARQDSTSIIISQEKYETIIKYLDNTIENPDPNKKYYFKKQLFNIQVINGERKLYRQFKRRNEEFNLPVAVKECYFNILYDLHCVQRGHVGINKMEQQIYLRYYGIPRIVIIQFIKFCSICNLKQIQQTQPRIKPIRSDDFLSRLQIDLVDMRHRPCKKKDKTYNWIAHVMDHFTKFHIIWSQEQKCAQEVCDGLEERVFSYFGLPLIFQSDNGKEFKNSMMRDLINSWDGNCKMVHGRPRHPQSQGLVEQANGTMEKMLAAMMTQFNTQDWVSLLPKIMYNLNTQHSSATKFMAYEIVFNSKPNIGNEKKYVETIYQNENEIELEIAQNDFDDQRSSQQGEFISNVEPSTSSITITSRNDIELNKQVSTIRSEVNINQEKAVKKMEEKHNKKRNKRTLDFEVGDRISVAIPRIDRGGSDLPRLPGIVGRKTKEYYEIVTEFGILNDCLRAGDLELYNGPISFDFEKITGKIPLRKAAMLINNRNKEINDIQISCECSGNCKNNRCKCYKAGEKCNTHCHLKIESKKCENCEN